MTVNVHPGASADTNSPFTVATANPGTADPLTVPAGAVGMVITGTNGSAGAVFELVHGTTKGLGYALACRETHEVKFKSAGVVESWFLNAIGSTTEVYVSYTFHT